MEKTEQQLRVTLPGRCVPAPVSSPTPPLAASQSLSVQNGWGAGCHEDHKHLMPLHFIRQVALLSHMLKNGQFCGKKVGHQCCFSVEKMATI